MNKEHEDLILRTGFHQLQTPDLSLSLEAERTSPTKILDNITSFPGAEYGCEAPKELLHHFVTRIIQNPDDVHMLFAGGESGNGKSRTLEEMMAYIFFFDVKEGKSKTRFAQFLEDRGLTVRFHSFPWGDASEHMFPKWMIDPTANYHDDPILHAAKQREVGYAEEIDETAIAETAKECNEEKKAGGKYVDIFIGDVPINTGDIIDGKTVGVLRGYNMIKDLRHKTGKFKGLNYKFSFFMLSASTEVREEAFADRSIITDKELTEEERRQALAEKGKLYTDSVQSVKDAAQEPATPDQMSKLQQDGNDVLIELYKHADPRLRPGREYELEITADALNNRATQLRVPMVGAIQHPHILSNVLRMPKNSRRVGNFFNGVVVDSIIPFDNLKLYRPIADKRDRIIQEIKAREEAQASERLGFYQAQAEPGMHLRGDFY